jgi:hypothetical protein
VSHLYIWEKNVLNRKKSKYKDLGRRDAFGIFKIQRAASVAGIERMK